MSWPYCLSCLLRHWVFSHPDHKLTLTSPQTDLQDWFDFELLKRSLFHPCGVGRAKASFLKECHRKTIQKEHWTWFLWCQLLLHFETFTLLHQQDKEQSDWPNICFPPAKFGLKNKWKVKGSSSLLKNLTLSHKFQKLRQTSKYNYGCFRKIWF